MIITPEDYTNYLYDIQVNNFPEKEELPVPIYDKIHFIDLESRTIDSPQFLSVVKDHKSESVYFAVNRYADYMDLAETVCLIQYKTADNKYGIYPVPYYDLVSLNKPNDVKMVFSWVIDGLATAKSGPIEYSIRFYRVDLDTKKLIYNLNTQPAVSKILYGMDVQDPQLGGNFDLEATIYDQVEAKINELLKEDLYWIEIK